MKNLKNLVSWTTRLFTAVVIVMGMVACDEDLNTDSGLTYSTHYIKNPSTPFYGEKIINDSTKRDSVVIDGEVDKIDLKFTIKAREDREVFVDDFSNPQADEYFSSDRRLLESRKEGNWLVYTYVTNPHKGVQVGPTGETVSYETLEEVATYVPTSHEFTSKGWEVENTSDVFKAAQISSKEGFTELDYTNGIKATYTGVSSSKVVNLTEKIAWFAKGNVPVPEKYEATGERIDYPTYTSVTLEKVAIYTDGSRVVMGNFSAKLPINVSPLTNWVLNVDNLGTYVSNAFSGPQTGKEARTAEKFFSYNNYTYRYANTVAGKENALSVSVPNDIVFDDGDVKYSFSNTSLNVVKGNETTTQRSANVYAYNVVANVTFGASQQVTLPGTINVKVATVDHYDTTGDRKDTQTFTTVTYEKFAIYNDGNRKSVAKDSENLPIRIVPETNWTINVNNLGTYVSNAFAKTLISKTPRKQGNFSYNEYCYRVYNTVAGQTNSFLIYVPNDIVREDKDAKKEYANTDLVVNKGAEATTFKSEDDSKKTYGYTCVANVTFGASQAVTLPGTINVKKATVPETNHEHGKVREVIFTTTQNENCSFYKSVCVIVFEDGYRSVGMAENDSKTFTFNMSSTTNGVNSAVYTDGKWQVSKAEDNTSAKCMIWRNEGGQAKRTLDFVTATAKRWNNGHNTIKDPRRSYTIIDGGYGVTLSLNGASGQTLHF